MPGEKPSTKFLMGVCFISVSKHTAQACFRFKFSAQANWRRVKQVGFSVQYVDDGKVRLFFWHVLSMSHVPLDRHDEVVRELHG